MGSNEMVELHQDYQITTALSPIPTKTLASAPMAPPRLPPELADDATAEILLRLPPDEPAHLVRAALVCKPWRRILSDPVFSRRYREIHRTPPLLGYLSNDVQGTRFVPSTAASAPRFSPALECRRWWALDCRHGRVLLHSAAPAGLVVWDPVTGGKQHVPMPVPVRAGNDFAAAVLCAASGCDHLHCHGGPFLVVLVDAGVKARTSACVYSSETATWSDMAFTVLPGTVAGIKHTTLVENSLYFLCVRTRGAASFAERILEYDLGRRQLSVFAVPSSVFTGSSILIQDEGGVLGLANSFLSEVFLWWRVKGSEGTWAWTKPRGIGLMTLLPAHAISRRPNLVGFVEGLGVLFVRTDVGVFIIELKSRHTWKVSDGVSCHNVLPFMSFYTPDYAIGNLQSAVETS
ncbi:hypothetical protein ACP70R_015210 [Stipagrostis hirtigluma subsp. patula]